MEPIQNQKPKKDEKTIREPVQLRSINTKEKILDTALELFCEKGYYNTTTNEIAKRAQVSIGSLYSYFKDKDTIFLEILEKYHDKFVLAKETVLENNDLFKNSPKRWARELIESLIRVHEDTKELNRELIVLSYYNPRVAEVLQRNKEKTINETILYFMKTKDSSEDYDVEAIATVCFDMISATVDRIVFGKNEIDRERLIDATIDLAYEYFSH